MKPVQTKCSLDPFRSAVWNTFGHKWKVRPATSRNTSCCNRNDGACQKDSLQNNSQFFPVWIPIWMGLLPASYQSKPTYSEAWKSKLHAPERIPAGLSEGFCSRSKSFYLRWILFRSFFRSASSFLAESGKAAPQPFKSAIYCPLGENVKNWIWICHFPNFQEKRNALCYLFQVCGFFADWTNCFFPFSMVNAYKGNKSKRFL